MLRELRGAAALLVTALALVPAARATEKSELRTKEGLLQLHAGDQAAEGATTTPLEVVAEAPADYSAALASFEAAVAEDPNDFYALYYRGVTRSRIGDLTGAVEDLRQVVNGAKDMVARRPDRGAGPETRLLERATLELGVALVNAQRYSESLQWLEQAREIEQFASEANFFLGLAYFRKDHDHYLEALRYFKAAEQSADLRVAALYYQGFIFYDSRRREEAKAAFTAVIEATPDSQMAREARQFLELLGGGAPYSLYAGLAFEYDSNVLLTPSSDDEQEKFGITNESDGRAVITAGGRYALNRDRIEMAIAYDFYQSLYFQITDFSLQAHRPSAEVIYHGEPVEVGFHTHYDFELLGTDSLLHEVVALPWARIREADFGHFEVFYRLRYQDYIDDRYQPLDAVNNAVGGRQVFYLGIPQRFFFIGYRFDRNDATRSEGDRYAYYGNRPEIGAGWVFTEIGAGVQLSYGFDYENYDSASHGRDDRENELTLVAIKRLGSRVLARLGYQGTFNDSTDNTFTYNRNMVSLGMEVRF